MLALVGDCSLAVELPPGECSRLWREGPAEGTAAAPPPPPPAAVPGLDNCSNKLIAFVAEGLSRHYGLCTGDFRLVFGRLMAMSGSTLWHPALPSGASQK